MGFYNQYYILLACFLTIGIIALTPSAFAATANVVMSPGASADQSCVAAKNCFSPNVVNISPGDTVTWTNIDKASHTATSGHASDNQTGTVWDSSLVKAGGTFSFTFQNGGTYPYFCMVHPWMIGEIVVGGPTSTTGGRQTISGATVELSQKVYALGDKVYITVVAPAFNFNPNSIDMIQVSISTRESVLSSYKLFETGPNTSIFSGYVILDGNGITQGTGPSDGLIGASASDDIGVSFEYSPGQTVTGTASIASPVVINPSPPIIPSGVNVVMVQGAGSDQSCVAAQNCFSPKVFLANAGQAVTWYNEDKVGHTATSGHPSDTQTGTIFDSSLIKAGGSYSFTFQYPGTYDYFCMVHPWMTGEIIVGGGISVQPISVTTDKPSYQAGDRVTVSIQSSSLQGQPVAVMMTDPSGNVISSRTLTISSYSNTLEIGLPQSAQGGTYQVIVTASSNGGVSKGSAIFTVTPLNPTPSSQVTIVSVQATTQQGNSVSSFSKGNTGYAKIVISSQSSQSALVTVNLVGADSTSLGVGSIKLPLNPGQIEIEVSFSIPTSAVSGTGTIYADVFSDWPTNGGTPLTGEASSGVSIG